MPGFPGGIPEILRMRPSTSEYGRIRAFRTPIGKAVHLSERV